MSSIATINIPEEKTVIPIKNLIPKDHLLITRTKKSIPRLIKKPDRLGAFCLINPTRIARGIDITLTNQKIIFRLLTPTTTAETELFYHLIYTTLDFYQMRFLKLDGRRVARGSLPRFLEHSIEYSANAFQIFQILYHHSTRSERPNIGLPSAISSIVLSPEDVLTINGNLEKFATLLHLRQRRKFIRAYPEYRQSHKDPIWARAARQDKLTTRPLSSDSTTKSQLLQLHHQSAP